MKSLRERMKKVAPDLKIVEQLIEDDDDMYNVFAEDQTHLVSQLIEKNLKNLGGASPNGMTFDMDKVCNYFKANPKKCSLRNGSNRH